MKESQNIEWKESWRDEYLKWICGFANAQGGIIYIGKNDDGEVTGISNAKMLMEAIPNKVRSILGIIVDVNLHSNNGKEYLEIKTDAYPSPVSYKGQYHFRSGSTKQELKGAALDKFLLAKQGKHWDGVPIPYVTSENLDPEAFKYFKMAARKSGRIDESILQDNNKNIIENLQLFEGDYLKRAAVLLFHSSPENFIPGAYVKIAFFRNDADLVYQDEIHGNLFHQAEKTLDLLLTKYMKAYISYERITRVERFLFPAKALREVLLNALVHRDYSTGVPIQIRVYDDQIRFWNDGRLPEGWTIDKLLNKHVSKPYNPLLANTFFRTGDIESWGRGIDKIRDTCIKNNTDFPSFEYEPTGLMVEFKAIIPEENKDIPTETPLKMSETSEMSETLLTIMKSKPDILSAELAKQLNVTTRTIEREIKKLKESGNLKRIGASRGKGGHWKVLQ